MHTWLFYAVGPPTETLFKFHYSIFRLTVICVFTVFYVFNMLRTAILCKILKKLSVWEQQKYTPKTFKKKASRTGRRELAMKKSVANWPSRTGHDKTRRE